MKKLALATEDELSEAIGIRLIEEVGNDWEVSLRFRKNGFGYLKSHLGKFCEIARRQPLLLITDLDRGVCATKLIAEWMGKLECPRDLLFRVAVREVESWLLADHDAVRTLLGKRISRLPSDPDSVLDPKKILLQLASKAPRKIRDELIQEKGAIAAQGLGYNAILCRLVRENWSPERAAARSDSLRRLRSRLRSLDSFL